MHTRCISPSTIMFMITLIATLTFSSCRTTTAGLDNTALPYLQKTDCTATSDCTLVPKSIHCCSGCGLHPGQFASVNAAGYKEYTSLRSSQCSGKKCPYVNCPVRTFCTDAKYECKSGNCIVNIVDIPNCKTGSTHGSAK